MKMAAKIAIYRKIQILLLWFGFFSQAFAILSVEITEGQSSGLPIAIVPFGLEGTGHHGGGTEGVSAVIRSDLENSGQFSPTSFHQMTEFPHRREMVRYPYWKSLGAENIVIGEIKKTGGSRYTVHFELLDVVQQRAEGSPKPPLLAMQFDNVHADEFRALAHHISDLIFEKLIGVKGIFSTRIAYVSTVPGSKGELYTLEVADSDGHNPKALYRSSFPIMSPAWSPDGKRIAFVSFDKDRQSVNIVEVATGKVQKITQFPGINNAPAWSPDNKTLALMLSKDGSSKIYLVDLEDKKLTRLTEGSSIDAEPCFTPDGRAVVFTSNRGGKPQIYRVTLGSGQIDRLTFNGDYNAKPSVTPDGKRLVMMHRGDNGLFSIAVQSLATGEFKIITQSSLIDSPSLAANGMMVLYGIEEGDKEMLGAVSLDGRVKIRLPAREARVKCPAWSPFPYSKH